MIKTHKYKLNPTKSQAATFDSWINTCRFLYNLALSERIMVYEMRKIMVKKYDQYNQLPQLKKDFPWLAEVYSDTIQEVLDRLDKTYQAFFRGQGFPKFSKKENYTSFTYKRYFKVEDNYIKLPRIGNIKYFNSRPINGIPKTATIVKEGTYYFICITVESECKDVVVDNSKAVGIDAGIVKFATLSDNTTIETPLFLQPKLARLRILQRKLSRQVKGSNSREKTKQQIRTLHRKITNSRLDFLHKNTTTLANTYSACYIEKLQLNNMVRLNSGVARKMLDSGFGTFKEMLVYKFIERGKHLGLVNPAYTSQKCSECLAVDKKSRLSQSEYVCTSCGHIDNADYNAAKNILREGISQSTKAQTLV
jgi:putative transposase